MNYWHGLYQTLAATLETGRIGRPVFVRCTVVLAERVEIAEIAEMLNSTMARLVSDLEGWFSARPHRVYALGAPDEGHIITTLEYPSGPTALLALSLNSLNSSSSSGPAQSQVHLTVLGATGAIYHDQALYPGQAGLLEPQLTGHGQAVMAAIEQSLLLKKPIEIYDAAKPQGGADE